MGGALSRGEALGVIGWGVAWFARFDMGGRMGSLVTATAAESKYDNDVRKMLGALKPGVFSVVWFILYLLNAIASYHYWRDFEKSAYYTWGIALLAANIVLNKAWVPLFFGARSPRAALFDVILILGTAVTVAVFAALDAHHAHSGWLSAALFAPYVVWLLVATGLNMKFIAQ